MKQIETQHDISVTKDEDSFESFYHAHFLKVKLSLVFLGVDEETAKDLTQESFSKLWLSWTNFESDMGRRKFLRVVSKNMWIDRYRKIKLEESNAVNDTGQYSLEDEIYFKDLLNATETALYGYGADQKDMYYEIKVNGCSYKEVSEKFEVNIKTLERYMTQMSKSVREYLVKHYPHLSVFAIFLGL